MKMHSLSSLAILIVALTFATKVDADYSCSFDLQMGVAVSRDHIRFLEESRTVFQINNADQLFVRGKLQTLDDKQRALLQEYAVGFHKVVPEVTLLAKEGIGLVADNITRIYTGLVGRNSDTTDKMFTSMKKVKMRVKEKFGRSPNYYFINPGKLENQDEVPANLQEQLESGFSNVSGIITAVGTFDSSSETDDADALALRKRARMTCDKLHRLNKIESELHESIDVLSQYDVIIDRNLGK